MHQHERIEQLFPWPVCVSAAIIAMASIAAIITLPTYVPAALDLSAAHAAMEVEQYDRAIPLFSSVIDRVHDSRSARLGFAIAVFAAQDGEKYDLAIEKLKGIALTDQETFRLKKLMPESFISQLDAMRGHR